MKREIFNEGGVIDSKQARLLALSHKIQFHKIHDVNAMGDSFRDGLLEEFRAATYPVAQQDAEKRIGSMVTKAKNVAEGHNRMEDELLEIKSKIRELESEEHQLLLQKSNRFSDKDQIEKLLKPIRQELKALGTQAKLLNTDLFYNNTKLPAGYKENPHIPVADKT